MKGPTLVVEMLEHAREFGLPAYGSCEASGLDLQLASSEDVVIPKGKWTLVPTGVKVLLPSDTEGQIRSRSGLALERGVVVMNSPGTIDADYRGEIKVILLNLGDQECVLSRGERIAQLVISSVVRPSVQHGLVVPDSERGEGGFGSTG